MARAGRAFLCPGVPNARFPARWGGDRYRVGPEGAIDFRTGGNSTDAALSHDSHFVYVRISAFNAIAAFKSRPRRLARIGPHQGRAYI